MQRPGGSSGEEWERLFRQGRERFSDWSSRFGGGGGGGVAGGGKRASFFFFGALIIALLVWLATGFYTVEPDEQALVRQFGRVTGISNQGLHWRPPAPIARHDTVKVTQVRRMEVGFRSLPNGAVRTDPVEALMITGDENIVDVEMVVLYRVSSISDFLLKVRDPGEPDRMIGDRPDGRTLKDVAEVALRGVVGSRPIDDVLTAERAVIEQEVKDGMTRLLNAYESGIFIEQVQLQPVKAPEQVQDAFDDVVRAQEDRVRLRNEAEAYANDIIPRARGNAERILNEARAFEARRINDAEGRAAEFLAILAEYSQAEDVTRERLYLEAMERILPDVKKFIIDNDTGGDLLQFLPLDSLQGQQPQTQTQGGTQ
ncbi:MAG: FtsH protease activity modulator HflK [Chloroflexota bacterium]|nr:FtsH protease activity modulator HflK [Chloroflexota bacterium]